MKSFVSLFLGLSLLLAACDDEGEKHEDPFDVGVELCVAETTQPCTCKMELGVQVCGADGQWGECVCPNCLDVSAAPIGYRYVRVDDLSNRTDGTDPGADIDAIILEKSAGVDVYADKVEAFELGSNVGDNADPTDALGAPNAVVNYFDPLPTCDATQNFVSLGGSGYLVVHMPLAIEVGDHVAVIEVGGCETGSGQAMLETVKVQMSISAEPDNTYWVILGQGEGPYLRLDVSELPVVALDNCL